MTIVIDPQASGWKDDGTESGILRAKLAAGGLVPVPFRRGNYVSSVSGTGFVQYWEDGAPGNDDGSGTAITVQITKQAVTSGLAGSATITHHFRGTQYILRYAQRLQGVFPFTVIIDGVSYPVTGETPRRQADDVAFSSATLQSPEIGAFLVENLTDGVHQVDLVFVAPDTTDTQNGTTASWYLYGYAAEARCGYRAPTTRLLALTGTLTTSAVVFPTAMTTGTNWTLYDAQKFSYFRNITYTNTSAGSVTVTITKGGTTVWQGVLAAAGTDGCTKTFDPGDRVGYDSTNSTSPFPWKQLASAGASVNFILFGGRH